jgi:hypothetical protein
MDDAQVQALVEQWRKQLDKQMTEMGLRKWCVERAIAAYDQDKGALERNVVDDAASAFLVVELAEDILKFVSAPFAEIFQTNLSEP